MQTVTFQGLSERVEDGSFVQQPAAAFRVDSMYDDILWLSIPIGKLRRDLIPNVLPGVLRSKGKPYCFLGTEVEARNMIDFGFSFLDGITSHEALADALEHLDVCTTGMIRQNDSKKIIPYLLSGQKSKAADVIRNVTEQSWEAYYNNCKTIAKYDSEKEKTKLIQQLSNVTYILECIENRDNCAIQSYLQNNYCKNRAHLSTLGVTISDPSAVPNILI